MSTTQPFELESYRGRSVLVTGSTGFKGAWLCEWLLSLGARVTGYALPAQPGSLFELLKLGSRMKQLHADIRDLKTLASTIHHERPDIVLHLAAQSVVRAAYADPYETMTTNVLGSLNLLEVLRAAPSANSLVYVTTDKVYVESGATRHRETDALGAKDPYGASKAAAEMVFEGYAHAFFAQNPQFGCASARAGNCLGGGDFHSGGIVADTMHAFDRNAAVTLRNPGHTRPWQHVLDVLAGYLQLGLALSAEPAAFSGAWNFGPGPGPSVSVGDLVARLQRCLGVGSTCADETDKHPYESPTLELSSEKAQSLLGWCPHFDINATISLTADWYRRRRAGEDPGAITRQQIAEWHSPNSPAITLAV